LKDKTKNLEDEDTENEENEEITETFEGKNSTEKESTEGFQDNSKETQDSTSINFNNDKFQRIPDNYPLDIKIIEKIKELLGDENKRKYSK
jgi:hypothetical protein